uniref:Uncharacterized protein n=1 Tax=Rhizophora mucronata TaxID=61149 RepID=A0A2P2IQN8_RHIMU
MIFLIYIYIWNIVHCQFTPEL